MESAHKLLEIDGNSLTLKNLVQVARNLNYRITLSPDSKAKMDQSRNWVNEVQKSGKPTVYGVNTGFGSKSNVSIDKHSLRELQFNLIQSHSAGAGEPLPVEVVRAAMLLRANTLAKGYSGIRPEVVEKLLAMLEKGVTPWVPAQGSVGASGDLAPLSHMALVLCENPKGSSKYGGKAYFFDRKKKKWILDSGRKAMEKAQISPIVLEAKEGLALNNGTQISTALLALTLYDARNLLKQADIAMALSLESLKGNSNAFRPELHQLRPIAGQMQTAENIRRLISGSRLIDSIPQKVQDAYSLRCHPQVIGAARQTLDFIESIVTVEMNATNDNPIIFAESSGSNKAISGGNFHAQPIAFCADFLSIVLCDVGNISERRIFRLSDKNLNEGLPSFLIIRDGLENGLMIVQYTASALASENKSLAHPASIDSIPTCENQEDHVSMAPIAARKAQQILENLRKIIAIELLFAAQAVDLRVRELKATNARNLLGSGTYAAYETIRNRVEFLEADRPPYRDIEVLNKLLGCEELLNAVEKVTGALA